MGTIPVLKPQEVVRVLHNLGFAEVRQRGSHKQFWHLDGRVTPLPFHKDRDISPSLLRNIALDIGVTVADFLQHRRVPASTLSGLAVPC